MGSIVYITQTHFADSHTDWSYPNISRANYAIYLKIDYLQSAHTSLPEILRIWGIHVIFLWTKIGRLVLKNQEIGSEIGRFFHAKIYRDLTRFCLKFYIKTPQNVVFFIICDTGLANCSKSYLQYCRGSLLYNLFSRKAAWLIDKSVNLWLYLLSNCVLCCFYVADPAWVIFLSLIYREMC